MTTSPKKANSLTLAVVEDASATNQVSTTNRDAAAALSQSPSQDHIKSQNIAQVYEIAELEYAKDVWHLQAIPGVRHLVNEAPRKLKFTLVPVVFRPMMKRYARYLLGKATASHVSNMLLYTKHFLNFYHERHPEAQDLTEMNRDDMEAFLVAVRAHRTSTGNLASDGWKYFAVMYLDNWILHLQRTSDPCAPKVNINRLIWPEDRGIHARNLKRNNSGESIKYIPEFVLRQVDAHLHEFMPLYYRPVVLLMRASGWRISDILNLRLETCLKQTGQHWWLQGDIPKTGVESHKVPITEDIVRMVQDQRTLVETHYTSISNPHGLLFPAVSLSRVGQGLRGTAVARALKSFIKEHKIQDEQGKLYHFSPHAFRHTKAVELINNGMPLAMVSQWLAHASLEMTTVYAKILDTSMRDKWDEAMKRGALRIQEDGPPLVFDPLSSEDKDEIEWEYIRHNLDAVRLQNGYCFRSEKFKDCPVQEIPCHTCVNFCTTPEFLPQFEAQRQGTLIQIELGRATNRPRWVERNEQLLAPIETIIDTLKSGVLHHAMGKNQREYTAEEIAQGKHLQEADMKGKED